MLSHFRRDVKDWASGTDNLNIRKKEAIDAILPLIEEIDRLWNDDLSRASAEQEKFKAEYEVLKICNNNELLNAFYNGTYSALKKAFVDIGEEDFMASLLALRRITINIGNPLSRKELIMLGSAISLLSSITEMNNHFKHIVYSMNFQKIYNNIFLINTYRKKYLDLADLLGQPDDIDEILGQNGEKIKERDARALNYIDSIVELANNFRAELSLMNARSIKK